MAPREEEIYSKTIDLLLDKGTLDKVNMNDVKSFSVLLYQSERLKALGKDINGNWRTSAQILSTELCLTEDEFNSI